MTILDQRHMTGPGTHETVEDVRAFWESFAEQRAAAGLPRYPNAPARTEPVHSERPVSAYISAGRWVADCLGAETGTCRGGIACWPDHDKGICLDCGTIYTVEFPAARTIEKLDTLLAGRPVENRNWQPGEQPRTLKAENEKHGIA